MLPDDSVNPSRRAFLQAAGAGVAGLGVLARGQVAERPRPTPSAERQVGLAYSTWFPPASWEHTWGEPELGCYDSADPRVIRQHAEWIADAGVDFVWLDWSNNLDADHTNRKAPQRMDLLLIERATRVLFDEYAQLAKRPRVSIFLGCPGAPEAVVDGRLTRKADQIHDEYVANPRFRPLLQEYLGKPLLVVYVNTPSPFPTGVPEWDDDRFTVRWMTGFVTEQPHLWSGSDRLSHYGYWSWEERGMQSYTAHEGQAESMNVVACWRDDPNCPTPGRRGGATFRERWARAHEIGPRFAMVVSWNEWVLGEQPSAEVSKDLEPSTTHGRLYLDILREEIARFKGRAG